MEIYFVRMSKNHYFALSIVKTKHMKCIRFEDGMKALIQRQIVALEIREYARLL